MSDQIEEIVEIIGHHGTTIDSFKQILRTNFRMTTLNKGWFGKGVYFFEDDILMAYEWVKKEHPGTIPRVIKADIEVPFINFLDLTDVKSEDYAIFKKVRDEKIKELLERNKIHITEKKNFDALVMEVLRKNADIHVTKVPSLTKTREMVKLGITSRMINCNEVIVSELNYIKNKFEIVSEKNE